MLIAVPSLFGISIVLFAVLALAPGDPFGGLATNPNVPPEVGAALPHWLAPMLHGDWVFSFLSRVNERQLPGRVHRSIMWAKLKCLAEGAAIASALLWH